MDTALASASIRLARCYAFRRRDLTVFLYTDHDQPIVISGKTGDEAVLNGTYTPLDSPTPSVLESDKEFSVDNMELVGPLNIPAVTAADVDAGLWQASEVWIFAVDWGDVVAADIVRIRNGTVGEIVRKDNDFQFEVRGLTQKLLQEIVELYTPFCVADLGDDRCKINMEPSAWAATFAYSNERRDRDAFQEKQTPAAVVKPTTQNDRWFIVTTTGTSGGSEPTWNLTIGGTTADGTVVWETIQARALTATVLTVTDRRDFTVTLSTDADDDFFDVGHVRFDTGANAGFILEIKDWTLTTKQLRFWLTFPYDISIGDTLTMFSGCDKTIFVCNATYDNPVNFRGYHLTPHRDSVFSGPDSPIA